MKKKYILPNFDVIFSQTEFFCLENTSGEINGYLQIDPIPDEMID